MVVLEIIGNRATSVAQTVRATCVFFTRMMMSGAMANDAERLPADRHPSLLLVMFAGEALVALAGAPAGLAFFWTGARAPLLWTIAGLLVTGLALQIWSWWSFFHAAS